MAENQGRRLVTFFVGLAAGALFAALAMRLPEQEAGYLQVLEAYGTTDMLVVRGRALEERPPEIPAARTGRARNLARSLHMLETDELEGRTIRVLCREQERTAVTGQEGFFEVRFRLQGARPGPATVHARAEGGASGEAELFLYPSDVKRVIVSDFDDTLCHTGVPRKGRLVWRVLTWDPVRMEPVDGMARVLNRLAEGGQRRPVFYLSGGPVNFHPRVRAFLERQGFPQGTLMLRNFGLGSENDPFATAAYKRGRLERLRRVFPEARFVLIGDSGEQDPEVYAAFRRDHPDRVAAIAIRLLPGHGGRRVRYEGMITFRDAGVLLSIMVGYDPPERSATASRQSKGAATSRARLERVKMSEEPFAALWEKWTCPTIERTCCSYRLTTCGPNSAATAIRRW